MTYNKNTKKHQNFVCEKCDFKCSKRGDFQRHTQTQKHKNHEILIIDVKSEPDKKYGCDCGKSYKHNQSLYNHKRKCNFLIEKSFGQSIEYDNKLVTQDTIIKLVNENNDIKNLLLEQQKQIVEQQKQIGELIPKVGNTIHNTANIKQRFNINIFLNEKCKDALNMDEFIKQIQLTLDNLDLTKNKGLTEGLSNIFIENMNKLSLYERPLHCTDTKRDILYIKDNDAWEKDKDKTKIKDAIKSLNKNHFKLIKGWMDENPDYRDVDEKQDYFAHLLKTCGANVDNVSDKVIKKICTSSHLKDVLKDLDETLTE